MSTRVRDIRETIGLVLRHPQSRAELRLLSSVLAYCQARAFVTLMSRSRLRRANGTGLERGWTGIREVATFLGRSERWVYDNWQRLPFARKWGGKALAFNVEGMRRWDGKLRDPRREG